MPAVASGMIGAGIVALAAGLWLVRARFSGASGAGRLLVLGPVFEAVALAMFAAEHFLAASDLAGIVPRWMPGGGLFWTYFVGVALLAAAVSFDCVEIRGMGGLAAGRVLPDHRGDGRSAGPAEAAA